MTSGTILRRFYLRAVGLGALGALVVVYLALVGMVARFEARGIITGLLTLGLLAPALGVFVFAYRATEPPKTWEEERPALPHVIGAALVAGLVAGVLVALFAGGLGAVFAVRRAVRVPPFYFIIKEPPAR